MIYDALLFFFLSLSFHISFFTYRYLSTYRTLIHTHDTRYVCIRVLKSSRVCFAHLASHGQACVNVTQSRDERKKKKLDPSMKYMKLRSFSRFFFFFFIRVRPQSRAEIKSRTGNYHFMISSGEREYSLTRGKNGYSSTLASVLFKGPLVLFTRGRRLRRICGILPQDVIELIERY